MVVWLDLWVLGDLVCVFDCCAFARFGLGGLVIRQVLRFCFCWFVLVRLVIGCSCCVVGCALSWCAFLCAFGLVDVDCCMAVNSVGVNFIIHVCVLC